MPKKTYRHVPKKVPYTAPEEAKAKEENLRSGSEAWAWYVSGRRPLPLPLPPKRKARLS